MEKVIVFDMDGILFDTENLYIQCWSQAAKEAQVENIVPVLRECIGTNETRTREIIKFHYGEDFDLDYYHTKARANFSKYIEDYGMPMKSGVHELLSYLKEEGYRIGLASSTKLESVKAHLKRAGIDHYFEVLVGGDMVKESKPNPEIYLIACNQLGAKPEETIAIEDSLNGIRAAFSAGMKPIMVPDLIEPTKEIEAMLYKKLDSLIAVKEFLMTHTI
ncbi:MAG: HAD family phosphatase [Cellulosilyticum sp.]|nr:HAD family phosphatase [Cellulosilyticum sp.]